jgi:hypothetical protein
MSNDQTLMPDGLTQRVQHAIQTERRERGPTALAILTVVVVVALFCGMCWIEFENISLALHQLFPTLRDGTSDLDGSLVATRTSEQPRLERIRSGAIGPQRVLGNGDGDDESTTPRKVLARRPAPA